MKKAKTQIIAVAKKIRIFTNGDFSFDLFNNSTKKAIANDTIKITAKAMIKRGIFHHPIK